MNGKYRVAVAFAEKNVSGNDMSLLSTRFDLGKVYGEKNFVSNGADADGFLVAVANEHGGYKVVFVDEKVGGVSVSGGTGSLVTVRFDQAPAIELIEGTLENLKSWLDHERWVISLHAIRQSRLCFEQAYIHCQNRESGGKRLINHQGIRWKLGEMSRQIEGAFNWIESITHQVSCNNVNSASISLCKLHATKLVDYCWRESAQIVGAGSFCDPDSHLCVIANEIRGLSVKFGSEEVLVDGSIANANEHIERSSARL
jgi:alkylation response protein AidB-like acyl-CoA dehydrogenase